MPRGALPSCHVPPIRAEEARMGPVAAALPNAPEPHCKCELRSRVNDSMVTSDSGDNGNIILSQSVISPLSPSLGPSSGALPAGPALGQPSRGAGKTVPKLSRLGELLNTQKNVHFLPPRGPPRGAKKSTQGGIPPGPPVVIQNNIVGGPEGPPSGGPGGPRGARGARGAPGGARAGGRKFPPGESQPNPPLRKFDMIFT